MPLPLPPDNELHPAATEAIQVDDCMGEGGAEPTTENVFEEDDPNTPERIALRRWLDSPSTDPREIIW